MKINYFKRTATVLIALFVMGDMCHAQILNTDQNLRSGYSSLQEAKSVNTSAQKSKAAQEIGDIITGTEVTPNTFMVVGSGYNTSGIFTPDLSTVAYTAHTMNVAFPEGGVSGDVKITGIFGFEFMEGVTQIPVTGTYDAQASTITIATPFDSKDMSKCVQTATYYQGDEFFTAVLAGCETIDEPDQDGRYNINVIDKLVFDVAADGTLTPRTPWVIYGFGETRNGIVDIAVYSLGKKFTEEASLMTFPSEVKFPDEQVFANTEARTPLYVLNYGNAEADCQYKISGEGLSLGAYPTVNPLSFNEYRVMLTASKEGIYNGNITISYDGRSINIPVTANVQKGLDYQSLVKNGTFKFSVPENEWTPYEPWTVTSDITGFPVAKASLTDTNASCGLNIEMEVPTGHIGIFNWKGITQTMSPNGFQVILDSGDVLYNNLYSWDGYFDKHPADGFVVVPAGKHKLTFEYMVMMDWYDMGIINEPQMAYIWDFDLQTIEQKAEMGKLVDETVDFGTWYLDKFIDGASSEASILNIGKEPLRVIGGENSESFTVTGIGPEVESMETLEALISFHGDRLGDYDETVTVKTNGGDFKVRCLAKAEKIVNDYQYLVKDGDVSFGTSVNHPFIADKENHTAYSSTAKLPSTSNDPNMDSWLSVSFVIPDGKQGTLSWEASNSSNDFFEFMDQISFTDGTEIYIDGEMVKQFAGICNASSSELDPSLLVFNPGTHYVKFNYVRKSSSSEGNDDRVVINSVNLDMKQTGISATDVDKTLVEETYYTLDGIQVKAPVSGICIRKATYSDGSVLVSKLIN